MGRGGHANSGPKPDPNSLRNERSDVLGWKVLPITGRQGDAPDWPLPEASDREIWHWERLWRTPQATEWETLGQFVQVAVYVRRLVAVEEPGATASLGNHVLRLEEGLGLTIPGLLRNRWQIGGGQVQPETGEPTGAGRRSRIAGGSVRGRLTVVPSDD
jgi:hypothetical protein